jgi:hypothetical protein
LEQANNEEGAEKKGKSRWPKLKREKKKKEPIVETSQIKILTFVLTFISMGLAFSYLPLFPQPLPIILAILVAFGVYNSPGLGATIGGLLIGFGLIYHLSDMTFISALGTPLVRVIFVVAWLAVFIVLPAIINRQKVVIALDLGILASMAMFFNQTYVLAIPLILASVVFFKRYSLISIGYFVVVTVPLQVMQFYDSIKLITGSDWFLQPGTSPWVYGPLNSIFSSLQGSMTQFRLYDTSMIADKIITQVVTPATPSNGTSRMVSDAIQQYFDSFPGIMLFVIIVVGVGVALIYLASLLGKNVNIPYGERLLMPVTASVVSALFFVLLNVLQGPLAYAALNDSFAPAIALFATLLLTVPISFLSYQPKMLATTDMVNNKINELNGKQQMVEGELQFVKDNLPINMGSTDVRVYINREKLDDIYSKVQANYYPASNIDEIYSDLDKSISESINSVGYEVDVSLRTFQNRSNAEYTAWTGKLKNMGLPIKPPVKYVFDPYMPVDVRIETIKDILENGRNLTSDVIKVVDPIYVTIRTLYDPSLPEECQATSIAKRKLEGKQPWLGLDVLYSTLNNWKKHYGPDVTTSNDVLQSSLNPIISLRDRSEGLESLLAEDMPDIIMFGNRAENIKTGIAKKQIDVLSVLTLRDNLAEFLEISQGLFTILDEKLKAEEKAIEDLLPTPDFLWERNVTLKERMTAIKGELFSTKQNINQTIAYIPRFLSYLSEIEETLKAYNTRKEFLLNYPMAKKAIEEQLKLKNKVSTSDLPFDSKFAGEYLYLFYIQHFNDYIFDKESIWLSRKNNP